MFVVLCLQIPLWTKNDKYLAGQLYCELNNLCRKCGRPGHFIGNCKSTRTSGLGSELWRKS